MECYSVRISNQPWLASGLFSQKKLPMNGSFFILVQELHLDFDVNSSWQTKIHQRINSLGSRLGNVDQTLVGTHFKSFMAIFEDVWAANDSRGLAISWQRYRSSYLSTGTDRRIDDLLSRLVDNFVVIRLEADPDALGVLGFGCHR